MRQSEAILSDGTTHSEGGLKRLIDEEGDCSHIGRSQEDRKWLGRNQSLGQERAYVYMYVLMSVYSI